MSDFKQAFRLTLSICFGFLFLGAAFSALMIKNGFTLWQAVLASVVIYAGSMQFALVPLLVAQTSLPIIALTTLLVNARILFYGLSFIEQFKRMGWKFPYMVFSLVDESFSIYTAIKDDEKQLSDQVYFYVGLLCHLYWIGGTLVGGILLNLLPFSIEGIDFSMTALFIVITVEQWQRSKEKLPFYIGGISALVCYIIFGAQYFLLISILITFIVLFCIYELSALKLLNEKNKGGSRKWMDM